MKNKVKTNLERNLFYRLIKVVYILAILVGLFLVGFFGWYSRPIKYVDNNKSYILCNNTNIYTFNKVDILVFGQAPTTFGLDNDKKSKLACGYWSEEKLLEKIAQARAAGISEAAIRQRISTGINTGSYGVASGEFSSLSPQNYKVNYIYSVNGSWLTVLLWWLMGPLVIYIGATIIRWILNYILFGRQS